MTTEWRMEVCLGTIFNTERRVAFSIRGLLHFLGAIAVAIGVWRQCGLVSGIGMSVAMALFCMLRYCRSARRTSVIVAFALIWFSIVDFIAVRDHYAEAASISFRIYGITLAKTEVITRLSPGSTRFYGLLLPISMDPPGIKGLSE